MASGRWQGRTPAKEHLRAQPAGQVQRTGGQRGSSAVGLARPRIAATGDLPATGYLLLLRYTLRAKLFSSCLAALPGLSNTDGLLPGRLCCWVGFQLVLQVA